VHEKKITKHLAKDIEDESEKMVVEISISYSEMMNEQPASRSEMKKCFIIRQKETPHLTESDV